ncbi:MULTISPECIES: aminotransferase class IV [unclassified Synechococcus]|uniref:aminotransferase class IV n=1 Tax=unclassified Synechococcus TaxID=2626047 RepID=UPI0021A9241D|nr:MULTISPECIES: aminotransferase class IV [unclassified Synechococcus]MCT0214570.1 aminotransferase class IV [Synechococcus sp. CS-1326]MCT0233904.1 aminotransferase class IV [Synechococcus sp. CS-1327]
MKPIAWIASPAEADAAEAAAAPGQWGSPVQLGLPLADRGLLLADGLFETVLVEAGQPQLLPEHLERWKASAALLGMERPPDRARLEPLLAEALRRSAISTGALRLNWSRGIGAGRGLDLPGPDEASPRPRFWLQLSAAEPCFEPVRLIVSASEQRNAASLLSRCKSFAYGPMVQARREARAAGADDALLLSTAGGLCCGTSSNLLVLRAGTGTWLTPPLSTGCLPGVMRGRALELGLAVEAPLQPDQLGAALLINSLGCRPVLSLAGRSLPVGPYPERFWRSLLGSG